MQKKHKNITSLKFRLTVNEEIKRGCEEESEGSPILIFPPLYFQNCENVSWLNGLNKSAEKA